MQQNLHVFPLGIYVHRQDSLENKFHDRWILVCHGRDSSFDDHEEWGNYTAVIVWGFP